MPWRTIDVQQQRAEFVIRAARNEHSVAALCREFGISRPTAYVWLERFREQGVTGLRELSRRPASSPQQTPPEVEARIVELRRNRPDWGARKLQVLLRGEGINLPVITVHRVLVRHGMVSEEQRHRLAWRRFERAAPNELWQADFKGPVGWDKPVGPLSVLDDHSRYLIALEGTWTTAAEPTRERLEQAFRSCGVPGAMLMDHGTPWWNEIAPSGWTQLLVWIMKQGIECVFSGYRHPQTQGKVERFHGSLDWARRQRGLGPDQLGQSWLDEFRYEYNHVRPHEALAMRTPAAVWRPSQRKYDPNPPRWEYATGAEVRRLGAQGKLSIDGHCWSISKGLAGEWVELKRVGERILVYYCNSLLRELDPIVQRSTAVERWTQPMCKGSPDNEV
jgi:transposase InsO family protein